jgi:hypothetical protein
MPYTIGYISIENNSFTISENVYEDLSLAAYDLNFTISETVLKKYDILLRNSFLFVCKDELKDSINTVKISNNKSIITEKKGLELNIFLQNEKKGYIYNSQEKVLMYKFFINRHTQSLNKEPFGLKTENPFEQGELVIVNEQQSVSYNTGSLVINGNTDEKRTCGTVLLSGDRPVIGKVRDGEMYSQIENSKEISFTKEDLVVLETWLDKNDSFVKELSEKVKKYKVD